MKITYYSYMNDYITKCPFGKEWTDETITRFIMVGSVQCENCPSYGDHPIYNCVRKIKNAIICNGGLSEKANCKAYALCK